MAVNKKKNNSLFYIAAVGASAGGLEALQKLLTGLPPDLDQMAFVIAQHLSPSYKSLLSDTLRSHTTLNIVEAKNLVTVKEKNIYITPPNREIIIKNGKLHLSKPLRTAAARPSIDNLFISLAKEKKKKAIGIVLSGTGADGASGIRAIKEAGGITIVQEPSTAKYNGMPLATVETGKVDYTLAPEKIGTQLKEIIGAEKKNLLKNESAQHHNWLDGIIELLSKQTGIDFTNYKPNTLYRRIEKRFAHLNMNSPEKYLDYIEKSPEELDKLLHEVLIGVTGFFRDAEVFKALEKALLSIINSKKGHEPIRIWVAGCATGEEVYSVAISLHRLMKQKKTQYAVQILATDINEHSLNTARKGIYPKKALQNIPPEILKNYFTPQNGYYEINKTIRSMVLFSHHDLSSNPPFLKLDLIVCRNLLIYFNSNLQKHVFPVFHSALRPNGYLLLGKSETVGQFANLFSIVNRSAKIYQRKAIVYQPKVLYTPFSPDKKSVAITKPEKTISEMTKETIFQAFGHPYVVVNDSMELQEIHGDVSKFLGLKPGLMNANLIKLAHNDLKTELRSLVNKSILDKRQVKGLSKKISSGGKDYFVVITVLPLLFSERPNDFYLVVFEEIKSFKAGMQPASKPSGKSGTARIAELESELKSVKEDMETYIERLESTSAEQQSTNEEFQAANEELKISNEELETTNEELQSANEEINIAYAELKAANEALEIRDQNLRKSEANTSALLSNTLQAFVLLDANQYVLAFNNVAHKTFNNIFGKRIEVGDNFVHLIKEDLAEYFAEEISMALKGKTVVTQKEIKTARGKSYGFIMNCSPILDEDKKVQALSFALLDITDLKRTQDELIKSRELIDSVFQTADIGVAIVDEKGRYIKTNDGYAKLFGYEGKEMEGKHYTITIPPGKKKDFLAQFARFIAGEKEYKERLAVKKNGELIYVFRTVNLLKNPDDTNYLVFTARDVTKQKETEWNLERMSLVASKTNNAVFITDEFGKTIWLNDGVEKMTGFKREEVLGKRPGEILQGKDTDKAAISRMSRQLKKHLPVSEVIKNYKKDGSAFWVSMDIAPVFKNNKMVNFIGVGADVTDLVRAKEFEKEKHLLEEQQRLFDAIAKNFPGGIIGVLDKQFHYVYAGGTEIEKLGITWKQLIGANIFDHVSEESNQAAEPFLRKAFLGEIVSFEAEMKDRVYSINAVPLSSGKTKEINQLLVVLYNITERKKAEKEVWQALLKQQQLNEMKSKFVTMASHEFRTPLSTILSSTYLIKKYTKVHEDEKTDKHIDRIEASVQALTDILNDFLSLGRIEDGNIQNNPTHFNLVEFCQSLADEFQASIKKQQTIIYHHEGKENMVCLDKQQLKGVLMNLLSNASKYSGERKKIWLISSRTKGLARFTVKDEGIGIPEEDQSHLFQTFFRAHNAADIQGTGMGLHIIKRFLDIMGGTIHFTSKVNEGSAFTIQFPMTRK